MIYAAFDVIVVLIVTFVAVTFIGFAINDEIKHGNDGETKNDDETLKLPIT
jgi:hypothetical protein